MKRSYWGSRSWLVSAALAPLANGCMVYPGDPGEQVELGKPASVDVNEPSETSCDVLSQKGCAAFQGCYPAGESGMCSNAGSIPIGGTCQISQACEPGAICASVGMGFSCFAVCDLEGGQPACSHGFCSGSGFAGFGICTMPACNQYGCGQVAEALERDERYSAGD